MVENEELGVYEYDRLGVSERMSEELFSSVFQAVGNASMCWSTINGAGTFNAKEAGEIAFELCRLIADEIKAERDAACGYIESTMFKTYLYYAQSHIDKVLSRLERLEAEDLLSDKTIGNKHRLEVELKIMQGLLDLAKEQLQNEDLKEDAKE